MTERAYSELLPVPPERCFRPAWLCVLQLLFSIFMKKKKKKKIAPNIKLLLEGIKVLLKPAFYSAGIKSWGVCVLGFLGCFNKGERESDE